MLKHSKRPFGSSSTPVPASTRGGRGRKKPVAPAPLRTELQSDGGGFLSLLFRRISPEELNSLQQRKNPAGRPIVSLGRGPLLAAILFHYTVTWAGSLGEHLFWLLGIKMSESNLSERRRALPFVVFEELLARVLRLLSSPPAQAFYRGLRLVAVDGVSFSMPNTEAVNDQVKKGGHRRGRNPFAKLQCAALVELVTHNPLAARLSYQGESEWKLAQELISYFPERCLVLADRLYGCGAFLLAAWERLQKCQGHFLVRVKEGLTSKLITVLADGSSIVEINALERGRPHRVAATLQVRQIKATIERNGYRPVKVRLWTSLLDCQQAPARELVELYATRWEQELYFRELKSELKLHSLLQSQTPETAAQEVAAMIIGSSLIAEERSKLKPGEELSHRISFLKVWETLEPLWLTLLLGADILTDAQKQQLCDRFYALAARRSMPKKRTRSCPRVLRQPKQRWPQKLNQPSSTEPLTISLRSTP